MMAAEIASSSRTTSRFCPSPIRTVKSAAGFLYALG